MQKTPARQLTADEKRAAYDAWYDAEIQKGLDDIDAGRVVSHDDAQAHMETLFAQLDAENRKAA